MITIDGGTGVILHNGADVAAPKMVDSWRLNVDLTNSDSDAVVPGSKFTRVAVVGDGMSVDSSSGVWTFPSTGKYFINCVITFRPANSDNCYFFTDVTTDNSSYTYRSVAQASGADSNAAAKQGTSSLFLDVSNTSNVKVRFKPTSIASGSRITYQHDTATYDTVVNFIKMGLT